MNRLKGDDLQFWSVIAGAALVMLSASAFAYGGGTALDQVNVRSHGQSKSGFKAADRAATTVDDGRRARNRHSDTGFCGVRSPSR